MKNITCAQFVFGKFEVPQLNDDPKESDFQPVAATPTFPNKDPLTAEEILSIQRQVGIGTDEDLSRLDAFFVSGPLNHGRRAIAHHLRSPARAARRYYYRFTHVVLIEPEDWPIVSSNLAALINPDLSISVHKVYTALEKLEPEELGYLQINVVPVLLEDRLQVVRELLSTQRESVLSILHGVLETESVTIKDFPDSLTEQIKLLQTLFTLVPPVLVDHLSCATQVFQNPDTCYARIKFQTASRALTNEYTKSNYVVDWPANKASYPRSSYSGLIAAASNTEEDLAALLRSVSTLDASSLFDKPDSIGISGDWVRKPSAWRISAKLAELVQRSQGLHVLAKKIVSSADEISGELVYDVIQNASDTDRKNCNTGDYIVLITHLVKQSLTKEHKLSSVAVSTLCDLLSKLDTPEFWTQLGQIVSGASSQHAQPFMLQCWNDSRFRQVEAAANELRTWVCSWIEKQAESSPQQAISQIETWKDTELFNPAQLCGLYLLVVNRAPRIEVLASVMEKSARIANCTVYRELAKQPTVQSALQERYASTYRLLLYVSDSPADNVSEALEKAAVELMPHRALYFLFLGLILEQGKFEVFSERFFECFLNKRIFKVDEFAQLLEIMAKYDTYARIKAGAQGAWVYVAWRLLGSSFDSLDSYFADGCKEELHAVDFVCGFLALASKDQTTISASIELLVGHLNARCLLSALVLSIQSTQSSRVQRELIQGYISTAKKSLPEKAYDEEQLWTLLELIDKRSDLMRLDKDLVFLLLVEPVEAVSLAEGGANVDTAAADLQRIIQELHQIGQPDATIATVMFEAQKLQSGALLRFCTNFAHVLHTLRAELDQQGTQEYVRRIAACEVYEKLPEDYHTYYDKLIAPSATRVSAPSMRDDARQLLRESRAKEFVQLASQWAGLTEQGFKELLVENWEPATFERVKDLLDNLTWSRMQTYRSVAEMCMVDGSIRCKEKVRMDCVLFLLGQVLGVLDVLSRTDLSCLAEDLTSYPDHRNLLGVIGQLDRTTSSVRGQREDEITLRSLLEILRKRARGEATQTIRQRLSNRFKRNPRGKKSPRPSRGDGAAA